MATTVHVSDDESYDFDFANPSNREVMAIERAFDGTFKQWGEAVRDGSVTALTCLVYVLRKRVMPGTKLNDVEFFIGDLRIEDDEPESEADEAPKAPAEVPSA